MAKRGNSVAHRRIEYLYSLAQRWVDEERFADAQTAIRHLRTIATKHTIATPQINKSVCKRCGLLLVAGRTCSVRVRKNRRIITCSSCGCVKRLGLT